MTLVDTLGMEVISSGKDRVEARMAVTPALHQPFGFLHGGATIALLETVASIGAENRTDFDLERPFGIDVQIRHRKSGKKGFVYGVAELDHLEGSKQFWTVIARDEVGDIVSEGVIVTKIVSLERLAQKERQRAEIHANS